MTKRLHPSRSSRHTSESGEDGTSCTEAAVRETAGERKAVWVPLSERNTVTNIGQQRRNSVNGFRDVALPFESARSYFMPVCTPSRSQRSGARKRDNAVCSRREAQRLPELLLRHLLVPAEHRRVVQVHVTQSADQRQRKSAQCALPRHVTSRHREKKACRTVCHTVTRKAHTTEDGVIRAVRAECHFKISHIVRLHLYVACTYAAQGCGAVRESSPSSCVLLWLFCGWGAAEVHAEGQPQPQRVDPPQSPHRSRRTSHLDRRTRASCLMRRRRGRRVDHQRAS